VITLQAFNGVAKEVGFVMKLLKLRCRGSILASWHLYVLR
jgi:hypothetical protein